MRPVALVALVALSTLGACAPTLRLSARSARYPVSLTGVVYGPDRAILDARQLESVGEVARETTLCALGEEVDLSAPINAEVERHHGEAVVEFRVTVTPPQGEAADRRGVNLCLPTRYSGRIVRRVAASLRLAEVREGCERHEGRACAELARRTLRGAQVPENAARAMRLFNDACDRGATEGCVGAASMWREGVSVTADPARASTYEDRACSLGAADACGRLGAFFADPSSSFYDPFRARASLEPSCAAGDAASCDALGVLLARGEGGARDVARAATLLRRACSSVVRACVHAAELYASPANEHRDARVALTLYALACDRGDADSCLSAGDLYQHGPPHVASPLLARLSFERACRAGASAGCERVASSSR